MPSAPAGGRKGDIAMTIATTTAQLRMGTGLIALALCSIAAPALAQDAAQADATETEAKDEIIVTAQRRSQSIQDVPIAITAVTAQTLKDQNVQSVEDYFALTPNVSFQTNGSRDRKDLSIRGISNQLNPYADVRQSSYAFYIDEFNVAAGTSNPQIVDLERIEVLRGPQGTYFGRNAVGGAINVITKKPVQNWEGELEAAYSNYDTFRAQGVLNIPVIPDLLAVRASAQYEKSDGYIRNINPIGGGNDSKFYTARVQARLTPTDRLTWDFAYSYSNEEVGMRNGVPTGAVTGTWASVYYGVNYNATGRTTTITGAPDGVGFFPQNDNKVNFNRPQNVGSTYQYFSSRAVWDFDVATLTGVVGHLTSDVFNFGDVDGGSPDFFYEDFFLKRKSTSGELRLQSNGKNFLDWSVGAFIGRDTGTTDQSTFHGRNSPLCPAGRVGNCSGLEVTGFDSDSTTRYFAIFGEATLHFTPELTLVLGGRYSWEKTRNFAENRSNLTITGVNDRTADFQDFSPKATLSYKPNNSLMVYATASRGFKSGGTQTSNNVNLSNDFDPETLWNYEVGTKFDLFDNRVRVDIAGFYMDWKNVQQTIRFQFIDPATGLLRGVSGIANAASAESYGIEGSFDAKITDNWKLGGQVGYNNTKFKSYPNALIDGIVIDISGRPLVNAPKWTFGAQTQYTQPLREGLDAFVRAEWSYRSSMLSTPLAYRYSGFPFISPSYHNVNLRAGIEGEKWRATVFVENLFDAKYFANAYEKAFYSGVQVEPSFQSYGIILSYKF
ncbi:TonB-dependent receptor [Sphingomonas ursincola]|uniref:TonB-dependent receptor n=2 Tax=Sphingomonas ursincola TaxID=56361 RepID=A0A7V8RE25_9SPHN|nr:TonB-dependent receptor [Sphingomonas ursincola]